jgi:two-component system sensor histidine kinase ChvG
MKTVRAVALIGAGLTALSIIVAVMILIVSQVEDGLIDARVQTLLAQGEIIAVATASQRTESDAINIDPEFPVGPERVAPLVRRLITPTNARARIYDRDGTLILDSRNLLALATCCALTCRHQGPNGPESSNAHLPRSAICSAAATCRPIAR